MSTTPALGRDYRLSPEALIRLPSLHAAILLCHGLSEAKEAPQNVCRAPTQLDSFLVSPWMLSRLLTVGRGLPLPHDGMPESSFEDSNHGSDSACESETIEGHTDIG